MVAVWIIETFKVLPLLSSVKGYRILKSNMVLQSPLVYILGSIWAIAGNLLFQCSSCRRDSGLHSYCLIYPGMKLNESTVNDIKWCKTDEKLWQLATEPRERFEEK